jgi:hypothetical protein
MRVPPSAVALLSNTKEFEDKEIVREKGAVWLARNRSRTRRRP